MDNTIALCTAQPTCTNPLAESTTSPNGPGTPSVIRRNIRPKNRRRARLYCPMYGVSCVRLGKKDVVNLSIIRADILDHLALYQCASCGKRFGRRSGQIRHTKSRPKYCVNGRLVASLISPEEEDMLHQIQIASTAQELADAVNGHEGVPLIRQAVMAIPAGEIMHMDADPHDLEMEDEEVQGFFNLHMVIDDS
ncbi:hypothetical protein DFH27DRAFT_544928 [Peziza echinospora]|nr:hypothetical protein DFH27DRAFT_544928 [Peziza echinospora]